jgi:hypothetical protein
MKLIDLPKIEDRRGNLSVIEKDTIPFEIKRVYYLYDVPAGAERGGHAHKILQQFLVAISGSFDVVLNNGKIETKVTLINLMKDFNQKNLERVEKFFFGGGMFSSCVRGLERMITSEILMILKYFWLNSLLSPSIYIFLGYINIIMMHFYK